MKSNVCSRIIPTASSTDEYSRPGVLSFCVYGVSSSHQYGPKGAIFRELPESTLSSYIEALVRKLRLGSKWGRHRVKSVFNSTLSVTKTQIHTTSLEVVLTFPPSNIFPGNSTDFTSSSLLWSICKLAAYLALQEIPARIFNSTPQDTQIRPPKS